MVVVTALCTCSALCQVKNKRTRSRLKQWPEVRVGQLRAYVRVRSISICAL